MLGVSTLYLILTKIWMCPQILVNLSNIKFHGNQVSAFQVVSCGKTEGCICMAKQVGVFPSTYSLRTHESTSK
jgi:hypothetical protein